MGVIRKGRPRFFCPDFAPTFDFIQLNRKNGDVRRRGRYRDLHGAKMRPGEAGSKAETAAEEGLAPFAWKHNALRHSFISYRVADIQNVAQVALEAGNSPQMIFKHYRELVRPDAAKAWFSIAPES